MSFTNGTVGSGSFHERGEIVLINIDRLGAIEGVMAFNHLKYNIEPFSDNFPRVA